MILNNSRCLEIYLISLSPKSRDWVALERKISAGKLVETAAEECGIPLDEALAFVATRHEAAAADEHALRLMSASAIEAALGKLQDLASGGQRVASEASGNGIMTGYVSDDLKAAQTLLEAGIKIRRLLGKTKAEAAKDETTRDLFDLPPSNWAFKARK